MNTTAHIIFLYITREYVFIFSFSFSTAFIDTKTSEKEEQYYILLA